MQPRSLLISIALMSALGFGASSHAQTTTAAPAATPAPALKGCYAVTRGYKSVIEHAHDQFIGTYVMALSPNEATNRGMPNVALMGPVSEAGDPSESPDPSTHTHHHVMGTFSGLGTLSTAKDAIVFTSASCPDATGAPRLVKGIQTLNFVGGTGAYAGLVSGQVEINGTFNACTRPTNPVLYGNVIKGVLCFR
jgi:hypothetical protein